MYKNYPQTTSKITSSTPYIPYKLLSQIISYSTIPKSIIEEENSELYYETLTGSGKLTFTNSIKYSGSLVNGLLDTSASHTNSTLHLPDGTTYIGEIKESQLTGEGNFFFPTGSIYSGHVLNGLRHGFGTYNFEKENIFYEGNWKNGLKDGFGKMKSKNMIYEGNWKKGKINGEGKVIWNNGNVYKGNFKNNCIEGYGFMIWFDLMEKYSGFWEKNEQSKNGIHVWFENKGEIKLLRNRYIGEWKKGIRNGFGIFFYANGSYYKGEWKNNLKDGFGKYVFENGKCYIGLFENDRMIEKDKLEKINRENYIFNDVELFDSEKYNFKEDKSGKKIFFDKDNFNKVINNINNSNNSNNLIGNKNKRMSAFEIFRNPIGGNRNFTKKKTTPITYFINGENNNNNETINSNSKDKSNNPVTIKNKEFKDKSKNIDNDTNSKSIKETMNKSKSTKDINNSNKNISKSNFNNKSTKDINKSNNNKENAQDIIDNELKKELGSKNLNKFEPYIDLRDLILLDNNIKYDILEIGNVLLRQYSEIRKLYSNLIKYASGEYKDNEEFNYSKLNIENPFTLKNNMKLNPQTTNNNQIIIPEQIKTNEISFSITLKDIWFIFRENGILNENFTIKDFDQIFYNGLNNYYNAYLIPENLTDPKEIYNYIDSMVYEAKVNFINKYINYLHHYYKEKGLQNHFKFLEKKKFITENSIHFRNNIILPRLFNECLIRSAFFKYSDMDIKLSEKLKKILGLLIQQKIKRTNRTNKTTLSRLEQSFNSQNIATETKIKIQERSLINDFVNVFYIDIQNIFKKLYSIYCTCPSKNNQSISYRFIYNYIIKPSSFLNSLFPNKLSFCEQITYFYKDKVTFTNEDIKNSPQNVFYYIENLFNNEMIEYEFFELIYLICKKYFSIKNYQGTKKEYSIVINFIHNIVFQKRKTKINKLYSYPILEGHIKKQKMIDKQRRLEEEERRKKIENKRFNLERKNMEDEDLNVYNENEDNDDDSEDDDY